MHHVSHSFRIIYLLIFSTTGSFIYIYIYIYGGWVSFDKLWGFLEKKQNGFFSNFFSLNIKSVLLEIISEQTLF